MKILKLLFLNILLLIILAGVFEICLFLSFKKSYPKIEYRFKTIPYIETISKSFPRSPVGLKYKKRPIMLMGCSYIYGLYLDENHSPHYKLSEITWNICSSGNISCKSNIFIKLIPKTK